MLQDPGLSRVPNFVILFYMLYILTALYCEARPFIDIYGMKKTRAPGRMQLFEGDSCRLAVGGAGPVNSVTAAAHILTRYSARPDDLLVNVGAAGSPVFNVGDIVLCHKIVNTFTGRAFYPEMLYAHPFREGALGSVGGAAYSSAYDLTDMEGAFVYEAALAFLPSSQVYCVKVISDGMCPEIVTAEIIGELFLRTAGDICGWLDNIRRWETPSGGMFTDGEAALMDLAADNLRMTFAMGRSFRQACGMAKIRGIDVNAILNEFSAESTREKRDGKIIFATLMERLSAEPENDA